MFSMMDILSHKKKVKSQNGEDGILEFIFDKLGVQQGRAMEFGAGDGIRLSNTYNLIQKGWRALLVEGGRGKFKKLKNNMARFPRVLCRRSFVSLEPGETLEDMLSLTSFPFDFDLISIDVDGNDYWLWKSLVNYKPKVVVIEYNPNWGGKKTIKYDVSHRWDGTRYYGATAEALEELGEAKGYDLICVIGGNLIFVDKNINDGLFERVNLDKVKYRRVSHRPTEKRLIPVSMES